MKTVQRCQFLEQADINGSLSARLLSCWLHTQNAPSLKPAGNILVLISSDGGQAFCQNETFQAIQRKPSKSVSHIQHNILFLAVFKRGPLVHETSVIATTPTKTPSPQLLPNKFMPSINIAFSFINLLGDLKK